MRFGGAIYPHAGSMRSSAPAYFVLAVAG